MYRHRVELFVRKSAHIRTLLQFGSRLPTNLNLEPNERNPEWMPWGTGCLTRKQGLPEVRSPRLRGDRWVRQNSLTYEDW